MSQIKIPLILFFAVFIVFGMLSFFSGSSWTLALFKACLSSIAWVVFFLVAKFFLRKYLPDMFVDAEKVDFQDTPVAGSSVDVRIGGGDSASLSSFEGLEPTVQNASFVQNDNVVKNEGNVQDLKVADLSLEKSEPSSVDASSSASLAPSSFQPTRQYPEAGMESSGNKKVVEGVVSDGLESSNDSQITEEELSEGLEKDVDRLEELPDLQEFVDSSHVAGTQTKGEELMSAGTQSFFETDLAENVTDTNLMANAVRTVLKREV